LFDVQLSGHTHSGQFFPWNLAIHFFHEHSGGLDKLKEMWVYVNPGTGFWGPPIRLGTRSEITRLRFENK
jgi:predicted MPP superfamily phosphohydrolase